MPERIDEYERLLTNNEIFLARTRNVGILPPELAVAYSVTGPVLRASGIPYDVRRAEPYGIYDRFDFDIPVRYNGDCYDRYMVRVAEMRQSVRILEQAIRDLPQGEIKAKMPRLFRPARGSAYARTESPKGRIGLLRPGRRQGRALSPAHPTAELHQLDCPRAAAHRSQGRRCRRDPRQHRHRHGGGRPLARNCRTPRTRVARSHG